LHCLIGQPPSPITSGEMREHVQAAVDMFLSYFGDPARSTASKEESI
jgi:hypothetical protein